MTACIVAASAYIMNWWCSWAYKTLYRYWVESIETIPEYATLTYMMVLQQLARAAWVVFITVAPFVLTMVVTILIVMYAQVGWLISFQPLEPKFDKIDPFKGFKNKINPFKIKQAFTLGKTFALILVIGWFIYVDIRDHIAIILSSVTLGPAAGMGLIGFLAFELARKIMMLMIILACVSYGFERWQWWKGLKMSDKEIKDEYKKLEGDPHIKGKQKQKMYQMAQGQAHEAVPNADVIITNPTHYAIALEYKPQRGMKAPQVIAKGKNHMALYIRKIAEENFIPTVEDPATARALYDQVKIGQNIPQELFVAVAKIIAAIMRKRNRQTVVPAPVPVLTNYAPIEIEPGPPLAATPPGVEPAPATPPDAASSERPEDLPPGPGNAVV